LEVLIPAVSAKHTTKPATLVLRFGFMGQSTQSECEGLR
jgi:hypothetical protein